MFETSMSPENVIHEVQERHTRKRRKQLIIKLLLIFALLGGSCFGLYKTATTPVDAIRLPGAGIWDWVTGNDSSNLVDALHAKSNLGGTWIISPSSWKGDSGIAGKNGMFDLSKAEGSDIESIEQYVGFLYWSAQIGATPGYTGLIGLIMYVFRGLARLIGGVLLIAAVVFSNIANLIGQLVFRFLEVFNIFKYFKTGLPQFGQDGSGRPTLESVDSWLDLSNMPDGLKNILEDALRIFAYTRAISFIFILLLFAIGLAMIVFAIRSGSHGAHAKGVFKRLFISLFALVGATAVLAAMVSGVATFGKDMTENKQSLQSVSGYILDYKQLVTAQYESNDDSKANKEFLLPVGAARASALTQDYGGFFNVDRVGGIPAITDIPSDNTMPGNVPTPDLIRALNVWSGSVQPNKRSDTASLKDMLGQVFTGQEFDLILGWMMSDLTGSSGMKGTYGKKSVPTLMYTMRVNNGIVAARQATDTAMDANYTTNYSAPGGVTSFARWLKTVGVLLLMGLFSIKVYMIMFRSIMTMFQRVIIKLPGAIAGGFLPSLVMLFAAVIVMGAQLIIGIITIDIYRGLLSAPAILFDGLTGLGGTVAQAAGGWNGWTPGIGDSVAGVWFDMVISLLMGWFMMNGLIFLNNKFGSALGEAASMMAMRLSGINMMDPRYRGMREFMNNTRSGNMVDSMKRFANSTSDSRNKGTQLGADLGAKSGIPGAELAGAGLGAILGTGSGVNQGLKSMANAADPNASQNEDSSPTSLKSGVNRAKSGLSKIADAATQARNDRNGTDDQANDGATKRSASDVNDRAAQAYRADAKGAQSALPDEELSRNIRIKNAVDQTNGAAYDAMDQTEQAHRALGDANARRDQAEGALNAFDKAHEGKALSPSEQAERNQLVQNAEQAKQAQKTANDQVGQSYADLSNTLGQPVAPKRAANGLYDANAAEIKAAKSKARDAIMDGRAVEASDLGLLAKRGAQEQTKRSSDQEAVSQSKELNQQQRKQAREAEQLKAAQQSDESVKSSMQADASTAQAKAKDLAKAARATAGLQGQQAAQSMAMDMTNVKAVESLNPEGERGVDKLAQRSPQEVAKGLAEQTKQGVPNSQVYNQLDDLDKSHRAMDKSVQQQKQAHAAVQAFDQAYQGKQLAPHEQARRNELVSQANRADSAVARDQQKVQQQYDQLSKAVGAPVSATDGQKAVRMAKDGVKEAVAEGRGVEATDLKGLAVNGQTVESVNAQRTRNVQASAKDVVSQATGNQATSAMAQGNVAGQQTNAQATNTRNVQASAKDVVSQATGNQATSAMAQGNVAGQQTNAQATNTRNVQASAKDVVSQSTGSQATGTMAQGNVAGQQTNAQATNTRNVRMTTGTVTSQSAGSNAVNADQSTTANAGASATGQSTVRNTQNVGVKTEAKVTSSNGAVSGVGRNMAAGNATGQTRTSNAVDSHQVNANEQATVRSQGGTVGRNMTASNVTGQTRTSNVVDSHQVNANEQTNVRQQGSTVGRNMASGNVTGQTRTSNVVDNHQVNANEQTNVRQQGSTVGHNMTTGNVTGQTRTSNVVDSHQVNANEQTNVRQQGSTVGRNMASGNATGQTRTSNVVDSHQVNANEQTNVRQQGSTVGRNMTTGNVTGQTRTSNVVDSHQVNVDKQADQNQATFNGRQSVSGNNTSRPVQASNPSNRPRSSVNSGATPGSRKAPVRRR